VFLYKNHHLGQYLKGVFSVRDIPTQDVNAYPIYPEYQWMYNKLELCRAQGIPAQPHGVVPESFPVFSKPITNLEGMSIGARVLHYWHDNLYQPGHFWMPILKGEQLSTDLAICKGQIHWVCSFKPSFKKKSFDRWSQVPTPFFVKDVFRRWVTKYLSNYRGIINCETIGETIIECHLRMSTQFIDLYGEGWVTKVAELYDRGLWRPHKTPPGGHSVILRTTVPGIYSIDPEIIDVCKKYVSSVQICFKEDLDVKHQPADNDDHTYRLAVINGFDLDTCLRAREVIKDNLQLR